eukprot:TRINITY_DN3623_c0_g1_i1.p1 TRINITY_DN3623_c0_g1~~TRINITY_DN3623_c0_g1_i1.p1  ORF type:complete len:204 (-),score=39.40 TRINITY_DN3623_c0_g1_i1:97-708(-)
MPGGGATDFAAALNADKSSTSFQSVACNTGLRRIERDDNNALFRKFDKDRNDFLNSHEVTEMLTSINSGDTPSKDEILFIITFADDDKDGNLSRKEMDAALTAWRDYRGMRRGLEEVMRTYGTSSEEVLEKEELRSYLSTVAGGQRYPAVVSDEDLQTVLESSGILGRDVLSQPEVGLATLKWNAMLKEKQKLPVKSTSCVLQ